jgi:hypothetical protein
MTIKTKKTLVVIFWIVILIVLALVIAFNGSDICFATIAAPMRAWPEGSCSEQVMAILDQRPNATVCYGWINEPGKPGHGQSHVQAQDNGKWLTIGPDNNISESDAPQYQLLPKLDLSAEKYRERYNNRQ